MKKVIFFIIFVGNALLLNAQAPVLEWVRGIGNILGDCGRSVVSDKSGNIYSTGFFQGTTDFDPSGSGYLLTSNGAADCFILKMDSEGNFLWAHNIGGPATDDGFFITVDSLNNIYVAGSFAGTADFDPGPGSFLLTSFSQDTFIAKYDSAGNFIWAGNIGGPPMPGFTNIILTRSISSDPVGNICITGTFRGTKDFDMGAGTHNLTSSDEELFVAKYNSSGGFEWAKNPNPIGSGFTEAYSLCLDSYKNVFVSGIYQGTIDFDPGSGISSLTSPLSGYTAFTLKLDSLGNFTWVKDFRKLHSLDNAAKSVTVDQFDNVYTVGFFRDTIDLDPGPGTDLHNAVGSSTNAFISKLDPAGNYIWAKSLGGTGSTDGICSAMDADGNIYVGGLFAGSVDFDPGAGIFDLNTTASPVYAYRPFVLKIDPSGGFSWARVWYWGDGIFISVDANNNIYTTGEFRGTSDFDPNAGEVNLTSASADHYDIFIQKINQAPVGITENSRKKDIVVYPNPTSGLFTFSTSQSSGNATIEIFNAVGALVKKQIIRIGQNTLDLTNEANGLYFINIIGDNNTIRSAKIIKQ
jgi:hypothetical protein